jgi:hypothetical protein
MEPRPLPRRHDPARPDAILPRLDPVGPLVEAIRLGSGELAAGHPGVDAALLVRRAPIDPGVSVFPASVAVPVSIPIAISMPTVGVQCPVVMVSSSVSARFSYRGLDGGTRTPLHPIRRPPAYPLGS